MGSDNRLVAVIGLALVAILAIPFFLWRHHESTRPVLREARIVIATGSDPVHREGARRVSASEEVHLAVALRIERPGQGSTWLAPVARLELDGHIVDHLRTDRWPEDDRIVRVFWFTVENAFMGGDLTAANAGKRVHYRTFLAPELGSELATSGPFDNHNDDSLGGVGDAPWTAGTLRFYARVEIAARPRAARVLQAVSSIGVEQLGGPGFPTIHRQAAFAEGVRPEAGELFLLPGFEPRPQPAMGWNEVTVEALAQTFTTLVERRLLCSARTFAAVAVAGTPDLDETLLSDLGRVSVADNGLLRRRQPLYWGHDVLTGDLVVDGAHWMVLLGDNGNGTLDRQDEVVHCWRRPAQVEPLGSACGEDTTELSLLRYDQEVSPSTTG